MERNSFEDITSQLQDVEEHGDDIIVAAEAGNIAGTDIPFGTELFSSTSGDSVRFGGLACTTIVAGDDKGSTDNTPPPNPPPSKDLNPKKP